MSKYKSLSAVYEILRLDIIAALEDLEDFYIKEFVVSVTYSEWMICGKIKDKAIMMDDRGFTRYEPLINLSVDDLLYILDKAENHIKCQK